MKQQGIFLTDAVTPINKNINYLCHINRMIAMATNSERLFEAAQALPEPLLAEVLDFAEFLRARSTRLPARSADISLANLCGGLENTQTFSSSPLAIQQQLRDEWR